MTVHERLLDAYGQPRRCPEPGEGRRWLDPVSELVSTILSQNTSDVNRDRAFQRLRERFPTWEAVRDAPVEEIAEAIRLAGLS
ncbi:MAG TPA: endonuclease III, partial [Anaerolineae bacterium]|nr:endonuclease III [Anaerolineae bacterium]